MIDSKYKIRFSFSLHSRRFYVAVIDARGNEIMRACDRRQRFAVLVEDSLCKILYHAERWTWAWRGFRAQYFVFNDTVSNTNGEFAMIPERTVQTISILLTVFTITWAAQMNRVENNKFLQMCCVFVLKLKLQRVNVILQS